MKTYANVAIALTVLVCAAALGLSIVPGILNDLAFVTLVLLFFIVPITGVWAAIILLILLVRGKLRWVPIPWKHIGVFLVILFVSLVLLAAQVPRRIVFAFSRPEFDALVGSAPTSTYQWIELKKTLGHYHVDEYAADPRGGVYFRVYIGSDGFGPDRMSYGFAHKPNSHGTPFGAARYDLSGVGGDWYTFSASDDSY